MPSRRWTWAGSVLVALVLLAAAPAEARQGGAAPTPVRLQLKWLHQFQFAGYYAALEKGYFADEGLDVELIEGGPTKDPTKAVLSGAADFGIGNSTLIIDRAQGRPVVAVAAIFQHSPFVIIARRDNGLKTVKDLEGRTLMVEEHAAELFAYLELAGADLSKVRQVPHTGDVKNLAAGDPSGIDAATAYTSTEPFITIQDGIPFEIFNPRSLGIDFYGDTLFTAENFAKAHPETVRAMRRAVIRGWDYASRHQDEVVEIIRAEYAPAMSPMRLGFEAQVTTELLATDFVDLGYMSRSRWQHIADVFAQAGMMPGAISLDDFLFDSEEGLPPWVLTWLAWFAIIAVVASLTAHRFYRLNHALKREIASREALEKALAYENDTKDKLFSIIAHDLRSPFTSLLGMTGVMSRKADGFSKEELIDFAHNVNGACSQVFDLLQNLLEWSRLQIMGGEPAHDALPLDGLVRDSLAPLAPMARDKAVTITAEVGGRVVLGEYSAVLTVLRNLITNAIKFTPRGGSVTVSAEDSGKAVLITVADTGTGMAPDKLATVFELDRRTSTRGTEGETGTGLGLPLARDLVAHAGGRLWIDSRPGEGTRAHFTLPRSR